MREKGIFMSSQHLLLQSFEVVTFLKTSQESIEFSVTSKVGKKQFFPLKKILLEEEEIEKI